MRRKLSLVFFGLALIAFGVIWGGFRVGLWSFDPFFDGWWAILLIVLGICGMIDHGVKTFDVILVVIGLLRLVTGLGIIDWERFKLLFWPAVMVLVGFTLIFSIFKKEPVRGIDREAAARIHESFSSKHYRLDGQNYEGGHVEAIFGNVDLDLRNSIIQRDAVIRVNVVFGAVSIAFPPNVRVETEKKGTLGSISDNVAANTAVNVPTVRVRCSSFCGSITLK